MIGVAAALAIVLIAVAIATTGSTNRVVVSATSTTIAPATGLTAEQLDAHTGVGVPSGWAPVDFGNARLFVPADWIVSSRGSCEGGAIAGLVSLGAIPPAGCKPSDQYPVPENAVAIIRSSDVPNPVQPALVHGYRVYVAEEFNPLWLVRVVPELGMKIEVRGARRKRSSRRSRPRRRRSRCEFAVKPVPAGQSYGGDGLSMTIPAAWKVQTPLALCSWPVTFNGGPALFRVRPNMISPSCPPMLPTAATAAHESALLYTSRAFAPDAGTTPIVVLQHGQTTVRVFAGSGDTNTLDLFVQRAGSPTVHVLTIGLGRDGRVAGGVLASIEATA